MWMHTSVNQLDLYLSAVGGGERVDFISLFSSLSHFHYSSLLQQLNQSIWIICQLISQHRQSKKMET